MHGCGHMKGIMVRGCCGQPKSRDEGYYDARLLWSTWISGRTVLYTANMLVLQGKQLKTVVMINRNEHGSITSETKRPK
jgi:hypothetical protein